MCGRAQPGAADPADRRGRRGQDPAGRGGRRRSPRRRTRPPCSRAAACPTARPTSGGRSPRALRDGTGIQPDDDADTARRRCLGAVAAVLEQAGDLRGGRPHRRRPALLHGVPTPLDGLDPARAREDAALSLFAFTEAYLRCVRSSSCCPTCTGPTTSCSSCSTACSERSAALPFVVVATARVDQDSGGARRVATTRSRSTSIRSTAVAARQLLDSVAEARLPRRVADQLLDRSGGQPVLPRGAGVARSATPPTSARICPSSPTTSAASSLPASTRCLPASGPRSKTPRCSAGPGR